MRQSRKTCEQLEEEIFEAQKMQMLLHPNHEEQVALASKVRRLKWYLATLESSTVINRARQYNIEIPPSQDKPSWWTNNYLDRENGAEPTEWLSAVGRSGLSKLIREERRKNIEWWVRTLTPIVTALISLLGLVVALLSLSKRL
jgi:hypothetical protein